MSFLNEKSDDICLTGMSGRFPNSRNVNEFASNLLQKVDMIDDKEDRWKHVYDEVPRSFGKIPDVDKFDTAFFSMLSMQARFTDPQLRMLLEHSYEAIIDAGISPQSLYGSRTGVFVACSTTDAKDCYVSQIACGPPGLSIVGNANFLMSNRVSYTLGLCGPSMTIDTACSSSAYALDCAYRYMRTGACDSAIVAGTQLDLLPYPFLEFNALGILSKDNISRPFDEEASGFVRGESVCAIFLQRRKESKRIYGQLVHSLSNNDGFKKEGPTLPSKEVQQRLMENLYADINFDPTQIKFVEAHATGTKLGDPQELFSIDEVFCKNRSDKLIIGSVKSNIGHAEAASGVASVTKIMIAFESGKFPPNINLKCPRKDVSPLSDGRIEVATEAIDLDSAEYIAMNSFGIGGSNAHMLFKRHSKEKLSRALNGDEERIVLWSGRTEDAVHTIFDDISSRPMDLEYIALLQSTQIRTPDANTYRGYAIFKNSDENAICTARKVQSFDGIRRPVVFVFAGMGTQWYRMGQDLLQLKLFADSIEKSHEFLLTKGIDLKGILTSKDENIYENFLNSSVGIISIEIALTDVLLALGIKPDFIIGHSVGEIGCSYADGCATREEALTTAYLRAKLTLDSNIYGGAMAAVGMNWKELEGILPEEVDIACQNSKELTTISGPKNIITEFVDHLKSKHCFAKEVACAGVPFHSRYIRDVGKEFEVQLNKIFTNPKKRSSKWLTTSFPEDCDASEFCDAKYQATNYINAVYFEQAAKKLPENGLMIEISPHGFLQSLLRSAQKTCAYVGLTNKTQSDGWAFFMSGIGKLFQFGLDFDISRLYPAIDFPVSRTTPMISPLIKWNHTTSHFVPSYDYATVHSRVKKIINLRVKDLEYVRHHVIDGKAIVPAAFWILVAWQNFSNLHEMHFENVKVTLKNLECVRATYIPTNGEIVISSSIDVATGKFSLHDGTSLIAQGTIVRDDNMKMKKVQEAEYDKDSIVLKSDDFYKHAQVLGYQYMDQFQKIHEITDDGKRGKIKWNRNWVVFIDCVVQSVILFKKYDRLSLPFRVKRISIDPFLHKEVVDEITKTSETKEVMEKEIKENEEAVEASKDVEEPVILLPLETNKNLNLIKCGGFELFDPMAMTVNRVQDKNIILEYSKFIPYCGGVEKFTIDVAIKNHFMTYFNNNMKFNYKAIEVNYEDEDFMSKHFVNANRYFPISFDIKLLASKSIKDFEIPIITDADLSTFNSIDLIATKNFLNNKEFIEKAGKTLTPTGVIITVEDPHVNVEDSDELEIISKFLLTTEKVIIMARFRRETVKLKPKVFEISPKIESWLEPLKEFLTKVSEESEQLREFDEVLLYSYNYESNSGLLGFYNCLRMEHLDIKIRCVLISDEKAPAFDISHPFYESQLSKNLAVNVLKEGRWGCYQHIDMRNEENPEQQRGHCFVNYSTRGNVSTLKWRNGSINKLQADRCTEDLIKVQYAALNFRDVVFAFGYIPDEMSLTSDCRIGLEFAGIRVKTGQRVIGLGIGCGAISTYFDASDTVMFEMKEEWSLEDASTIYVAYLTVYTAFFYEITIEKGKSILIHSGAGGVGQAALHTAFAYGLEVFTTVGTEEKREFLLKTFPQLKPEHIGNSRDTSFYDMIMTHTNGRGVDYVLNSLFDEKMMASLNCVAVRGYFLEIGQADIVKGTKIDLKHLEKFITIKWIKVDKLDKDEPLCKETIERVRKDIDNGIIKPLSRTVFDAKDVIKAFHYMSTGNHMGKVLIKVREHESDELSLPICVTPRFYCDSEHSYIIIGGLGGIGLEFCQWLLQRKCRKLLLSSSRGISNQYQAFKIKYWQSFGVEVLVSTSSVATIEGCKELVDKASALGPVGGIFNLALVLRDGAFINQTVEEYEQVLMPKAIATENMHEVSQRYCPELKHFVVYSSIVCGRGSPGQTNYGMANSIMERIIEKRHASGLPAKAIQLGPIGDVGVLANKELNYKDKLNFEVPLQSIASLLEHHDSLLMDPEPIVSSTIMLNKKGVSTSKEGFIEMLMKVLNIEDRKTISMNSTFSQLGIDSLAGVELHQMIEREYGITITASELRSLTISELETKVNAHKKSIEVEDADDESEEYDNFEMYRD